jgi:flagellar FliJ protein
VLLQPAGRPPITPVVSRPFTFRLERVLDVRARAEARAQEALVAALAAREAGLERLHGAERALESGRDAARAAAADPAASGPDLIFHQAYLERAQRAARAAALELDRLDAEVDGRRRALEAAARERQVLERLKERRQAEHELEALRLEGALIDEMALAVHRRGEAGR